MVRMHVAFNALFTLLTLLIAASSFSQRFVAFTKVILKEISLKNLQTYAYPKTAQKGGRGGAFALLDIQNIYFQYIWNNLLFHFKGAILFPHPVSLNWQHWQPFSQEGALVVIYFTLKFFLLLFYFYVLCYQSLKLVCI